MNLDTPGNRQINHQTNGRDDYLKFCFYDDCLFLVNVVMRIFYI